MRHDHDPTGVRGNKSEVTYSGVQLKEGNKHIVRNKNGNDQRLHLVLDAGSWERLDELCGMLEAASHTEVVRRALQAYALFDPVFVKNDLRGKVGEPTSDADFKKGYDVYVRVSHKLVKQMNAELSERGLTYGEQVMNALCVMYQLVRNRDRMLSDMSGSDETSSGSTRRTDSPAMSHDDRDPSGAQMRELLAVC